MHLLDGESVQQAAQAGAQVQFSLVHTLPFHVGYPMLLPPANIPSVEMLVSTTASPYQQALGTWGVDTRMLEVISIVSLIQKWTLPK